MTWEEFREFFMGKFFPASTRHAKSREFLELKQGTMTLLEYVAKFIELASFADDYVATDMAKVLKFKDGLKFSIQGEIVGFLLQDMGLMMKTTMTIEREVDDARNIWDLGVKDKRRESYPSSSSSEKKQRSYIGVLVSALVSATAKLIWCSCGISCLHSPKVHSRSDSCSGLGQAYY